MRIAHFLLDFPNVGQFVRAFGKFERFIAQQINLFGRRQEISRIKIYRAASFPDDDLTQGKTAQNFATVFE